MKCLEQPRHHRELDVDTSKQDISVSFGILFLQYIHESDWLYWNHTNILVKAFLILANTFGHRNAQFTLNWLLNFQNNRFLYSNSVNMVRQKFVPLFTESGTERQMVVILPGRHPCQCLAVRHKLIGNCSSCGRIVCEQEGSGLCYFCGNLVCSPEEKKTLSENTRASDKLRNRLMGLPWAPGTPTPPYVASRPPRRRNRNKNGAQCQSQEAVDGLIWTAEHPNDDDDIDNDGDFIDDDVEDDKILPDADAQTRLEEGMLVFF